MPLPEEGGVEAEKANEGQGGSDRAAEWAKGGVPAKRTRKEKTARRIRAIMKPETSARLM